MFAFEHAKVCYRVRLSTLDDLTAQRNATNCIGFVNVCLRGITVEVQ